MDQPPRIFEGAGPEFNETRFTNDASVSSFLSTVFTWMVAGLAVTEPEFSEPPLGAAPQPQVPDRPQRSVLQAAAEAAERRRGRLAQVATGQQ